MQGLTISKLLIIILLTRVVTKLQTSLKTYPDLNQLEIFRQSTKGPVGVMTTSAGAPVPLSEAINTLNTRLIFNEYFIETLSQAVRERLPDRIVHSKGVGAFGYFEVIHNISSICKAKVFSKDGKKTPVAVRFSSILNEKGSSDTTRGGQGFAIKFYTEDGNFDLVGLNIPVFVIKDPSLFPSFVRAMKRNPATNLLDQNMMWDFLTLHPESLHMFLYMFGDLGIPYSYRHIQCFSIHSFQVANDQGDTSYIRFHVLPQLGVKTLTSEQARIIQGYDSDYYGRDLYRAISTGNFPVWHVHIQVFTLEDLNKEGYNLFDVTRILPTQRYPLKLVGKLVLNRNTLNYFADIEQMAMNPANLVDGILGGPDTLFEGRRLFYRESLAYRLSINYNKIYVNYPFRSKPLVYNRDSRPPVRYNEKNFPNYSPNSFNGPIPRIYHNKTALIKIFEDAPSNFDQTRDLYLGASREERDRIIENILDSIKFVVGFIQKRAIHIFKTIHPELGCRIEEGLFRNNISNYSNDLFV